MEAFDLNKMNKNKETKIQDIIRKLSLAHFFNLNKPIPMQI